VPLLVFSIYSGSSFSIFIDYIRARSARCAHSLRFASLRFASRSEYLSEPRFLQNLQNYRDYTPQRHPGSFMHPVEIPRQTLCRDYPQRKNPDNLFNLTEITVRTMRKNQPQLCSDSLQRCKTLPQVCSNSLQRCKTSLQLCGNFLRRRKSDFYIYHNISQSFYKF
jgi:hypothetical protein